jgi:hypothetical protein
VLKPPHAVQSQVDGWLQQVATGLLQQSHGLAPLITSPVVQHAEHVPLLSEVEVHGTKWPLDEVLTSQHVTVWGPMGGFLAALSAVTPHAHPQLGSGVAWPQQPPAVAGTEPGVPVQLPAFTSGQVILEQPLREPPTLQDDDRLLEAEQQQQQPMMDPAPKLFPQSLSEKSSHWNCVGVAEAAAEGTLIE